MRKSEYLLPLVTVLYFDKDDIVTASTIGDSDDETVTDQEWGE